MISLLANLLFPKPNNIVNGNGAFEAQLQSSENNDSYKESVIINISPQAQKRLENSKQSAMFTKDSATNQPVNRDFQSQPSTAAKSLSQKNQQLSEADLRTIQKLETQDLHVKMHEQQHMAVAGAYAKGGPSYSYTKGPDGKSYVVGGEVQIDMSPVPNNPEATIHKAEVIRQGALAPADPSGADRSVAAAATQMEAKAKEELAKKDPSGTSGVNSSSQNTNPTDKNHASKVQAYKNLLRPNQTGRIINQSA